MRQFFSALLSLFQPIPARRRYFYLVAFTLSISLLTWRIWAINQPEPEVRPTISMTQLIQDGRAGAISNVVFQGNRMIVTYRDGHEETSVGWLPEPIFLEFVSQGIELKSAAREDGAPILEIVMTLMLASLSGAVLFTMLRGSSRFAMGGKPMLFRPGQIKSSFADVAGQPEAKIDLAEIVECLRDPARFKRLGANTPKGVLLSGPPGVGKTLLARAVAGEASAHMIVASGSNFRETYMGQGSRKVRQMFALARKKAPCIIFIDEIETLGRRRGGGGAGAVANEEDSTLNTLLVELDGFTPSEGVVLIAATNRPDMIDEALKRPGRCDRHVVLDYPDLEGRRAILRIHAKTRPMADDVNLDELARTMTGMSGASLANLLNEAAMIAAQRHASVTTNADIEQAHLNILLGRAKDGSGLSADDIDTVAVHEAGHALIAACWPGANKPKQATIIPRGRSLGAVIPDQVDRKLLPRFVLRANIAVALAGRAAETIVFGADKATTGASDDFRQASNIALRMAGEWNLATDVPDLYPTDASSPAARIIVEKRARAIIAEIWHEVCATIAKERTKLDAIAFRLKAQESVPGEEILAIVEGKDRWSAAA